MKSEPTVLFEDDDIIIVNKPPHLLSIPDRYDAEKPNLLHWLGKTRPQVFVVHRLDRETSGIICYAKTENAHRSLSQQFENRTAAKTYLVLVQGRVAEEESSIELPIAHSQTTLGKMVIAKRGKPSLTLYKVIEYFKQYTLLEANIQTGRTHQIRVHFEALGHPLAVDAMYGKTESIFLSAIKQRNFKTGKYSEEERPLMSRVTLHASKLGFTHPVSGQWVEFEAEPPKDFHAVLQQLRKWGK